MKETVRIRMLDVARQGRKDKCTLAAHSGCDGRRCEVRRLARRAEVA